VGWASVPGREVQARDAALAGPRFRRRLRQTQHYFATHRSLDVSDLV
jgi:hypothetical protein